MTLATSIVSFLQPGTSICMYIPSLVSSIDIAVVGAAIAATLEIRWRSLRPPLGDLAAVLYQSLHSRPPCGS